jgi:hypothetical protein
LEATTGQAGVRLVKINRPDLILMGGVQMPVLDGHEVTLCGMLVDDASVLRHSRSDGGHRETNGAG